MNYIARRDQTRLASFAIAWALLFGCWGALGANAHANGRAVRLDRQFKLKAGQQVTVKGKSLHIKFVKVENDSRCPRDVTCVWAGNAAVIIRVGTRGDGRTLTLNTAQTSTLAAEAEYRGYKLTLMELSPYPRSSKKIPARSYTATIVVSEK